MNIPASSWFLILIIAAMAGVVGVSLTFTHFESAFLPLILAGLIIVLGVVELGRELLPAKEKKEQKEEDHLWRKGSGFYALMSWVVGFALGIYVLGYLIAIPLFIISYLKVEKWSLSKAALVALATTALIYVIFDVILRARLWKGMFLE